MTLINTAINTTAQYYGTMVTNQAIMTAGRIASSSTFTQAYIGATNLTHGIVSSKTFAYTTGTSIAFGFISGVTRLDNGNWTNAINGGDFGLGSHILNIYGIGNGIGNAITASDIYNSKPRK